MFLMEYTKIIIYIYNYLERNILRLLTYFLLFIVIVQYILLFDIINK